MKRFPELNSFSFFLSVTLRFTTNRKVPDRHIFPSAIKKSILPLLIFRRFTVMFKVGFTHQIIRQLPDFIIHTVTVLPNVFFCVQRDFIQLETGWDARSLTSVIVLELVLPSWYQPLTNQNELFGHPVTQFILFSGVNLLHTWLYHLLQNVFVLLRIKLRHTCYIETAFHILILASPSVFLKAYDTLPWQGYILYPLEKSVLSLSAGHLNKVELVSSPV